MNPADDIDALKSFVDDNEDLERLESMLDRFNLFESLGIVRQEIRHSAFLRWILDPTETHGLGDYWLRQFLRKVIKIGEGILNNAPSLFDLDDWNLGRAEVRKEWRNIDILIIDEANRFVCVIENKVDSSQAIGQLRRYWELVEREFEGYKRAYVFLTRVDEKPQHSAYVSVKYTDITDVIGDTLERRESQLNPDIKLFIQHYLDLVRRRIVEDSEVHEICRRIYQNHRRALDLIFEYRPDRAAEVSQSIQSYITSQEDLIPISFNKTYLKFLPKAMDIPIIRHEGQIILTWLLENRNKKVQFRLEMRPGPAALRKQIYDKASCAPRIFGKPKPKLSPQFHTFFSETWISGEAYNDLDDEEIGPKIRERINSLMNRKGGAIIRTLSESPTS